MCDLIIFAQLTTVILGCLLFLFADTLHGHDFMKLSFENRIQNTR